jgi:hypothetical protein
VKYKLGSAVLVILVGVLVASIRSQANSVPSVVPIIVKHVALVNRNASVPPTTLYTPPTSGLYRVSAYASSPSNPCYQPPGLGNVPECDYYTAAISWVDNYHATQTAYVNEASGEQMSEEGSYGDLTQVIYATAGTPISLNVVATDPCRGPCEYSLYFTVECLGP